MPYTKEQLKNNEYYERVIEAARREQKTWGWVDWRTKETRSYDGNRKIEGS